MSVEIAKCSCLQLFPQESHLSQHCMTLTTDVPALELQRDCETEDIRRTKSASVLDALLDGRVTENNCFSASVDQMAVADPLPPSFMGTTAMQANAFSRFSQLRRVEAPTSRQQPPFTLESLAVLLDKTSPTNDLAYLTADYYATSSSLTTIPRTAGEASSKRYIQKSRSFPKVKRDAPLKSCVSNEKVLRRSKSVRFADSQGLPLIEAHQLSVGDSSYTENKIVPYDDACELQPVRVVSCRQSKAEHTTAAVNKVEAPIPSLIKPPTPPPTMVVPKLSRQLSPLSPPANRRMLRFSQPGSEPGFFERVSRDSIALESVRDEPRMIRGVIRVSNISYHKEVTVRWSHDHWRSFHDTSAIFSANDGLTDRFTFELPANGEDIEFSLRYRCEGAEYWDSNRGKNYVVESLR